MLSGDAVVDERGVSESASVAVLLLMTVFVTAAVGIGVVFLDETADEGPSANFTFQHFRDSQRLLVTHDEGDTFAAGDLIISGPVGNVTWAASAGYNNTRNVTVGDAVQVGDQGPYGGPIQLGETIRVIYAPETGNATVLDRWERGIGTTRLNP